MAVRVSAMVWDGFPLGGSDLLAMLALADWSDDDGRCFPSMSAIASKTRLSRSQAQRVVHGLIDGGYIQVVGNEFGGAPGATRQYRIILSSLTGRVDATPTGRMGATGSAYATGSADTQDGSHGCAETGRMGATQTVSEPSLTVKGGAQARLASSRRSRSEEITLAQFLENCKASGEKAIPEDDPVMEYAEKVGITNEMLAVAWAEFKAAYLPTSKRYKDWRQAFRNAVRRNWYKLWFLAEGQVAAWTTAGEQARRAAA